MSHRIAVLIVAVILSAPARNTAPAQLPPVRDLGPVVAAAPRDSFKTITGVRPLPGGRLLLNDDQRRTLLLLDSTLAIVGHVLDSAGQGLHQYPSQLRTVLMFPYLGDSTFVIDAGTRDFLIIDPMGRVVGRRPTPREQDAVDMSSGNAAFIDPRGGLVYRKLLAKPPQPDVQSIIRVDAKTAWVDTLAYFQAPRGIPISVTATPSRGVQLQPPSATRRTTLIDAFQSGDDWVLTPDGALAIVRVQDYHVDWIDPDGTHRASPPVGWPSTPLSEIDKGRIADSLQRMLDLVDAQVQLSRAGRGSLRPMVPTNDSIVIRRPVADVPPPFAPRQTRADLDQRLWVLEGPVSMISSSRTPKVYDIIDRSGRMVDRVRLPAGASLAGFGPAGTVYLSVMSPRGVTLERARFKASG